MRQGRATSIFLQNTNPLRGVWVAPRDYSGINRAQRWRVVNGKVEWEPNLPPDAHLRIPTIEKLISLSAKTDMDNSKPFLKLSGTTKTGVTWSLPPIAACPIIDETCSGCYALDGWYRTNLAAQFGRVKRLEYLQELIQQERLNEWVDWISERIRRLRTVEAFPRHVVNADLNAHLESQGITGQVAFFRWHDSGDIFHAEYAKAIFRVCEATSDVFHWMPTRMGPLVAWLSSKGVKIPGNLTIQISTHMGGRNEEAQINAARQINARQPDARVGLTYVFSGPASRKVDMPKFREQFGSTATVCPATIAEKSEDRVCDGCRLCWAGASIKSPIVYVIHQGN